MVLVRVCFGLGSGLFLFGFGCVLDMVWLWWGMYAYYKGIGDGLGVGKLRLGDVRGLSCL